MIKKMKALFPFDAKGVFGHVNLRDGEEVVEVTPDKTPDKTGWTVVKKEGGDEGAVPTTYLGTIKIYINIYISLSYLGEFSKYETKKYKVLFPYDAKGIFGHLSIKEDEEIVEVQPNKEGYTVVKNAKAEQEAVPSNYLGNQLAILHRV